MRPVRGLSISDEVSPGCSFPKQSHNTLYTKHPRQWFALVVVIKELTFIDYIKNVKELTFTDCI